MTAGQGRLITYLKGALMTELLFYIALSFFKYGGKYYKAGTLIELTLEDAKPLLELGVIELATDQAPIVEEQTTSEKVKLNAVVGAIANLSPYIDGHFTQSGKPKTEALEAIVDFEVSAQMRDEAFALFNEQSD